MFKSVFTKYILSFLLIFTVSFLSFGVIIFGYVSEYARSELTSSVRSASFSAKIMLDKMYENYFSQSEDGKDSFESFIVNKRSDVEASILGIAKFSNVGILIVDQKGTTVAATAPEYLGKSVSEGFYKGQYAGSAKETVKGLIEKPSYLSVVPLSGNERNFVLSFNLVDSDTVILKKVAQAVAVAAAAVFVFGFGAFYLLSSRMVTPLKEMSSATKRFALGDFSARVPVHGKDEIADLATAFNDMAQSLSDLEVQRSTFLANVSHDLRTPMTSISGFIDGILDGTIKEQDRDHYLGIISAEIKRLSRLVRTLLEISRIEAGVRKFNMVNFDLCEMIMTILFSFEKQIDGKKLNVEYVCDKDRVYVRADSDAIYQVAYNLIDNAVKFSCEGKTLRVAISDTGKKVWLEVYNEGEGIPEEDLPHVFDRFYKADKSRGKDKTGVGLGLFIAKAILQAHGESISVDSKEGEYCRFTLTLPRGEQPQKRHPGVSDIPDDR